MPVVFNQRLRQLIDDLLAIVVVEILPLAHLTGEDTTVEFNANAQLVFSTAYGYLLASSGSDLANAICDLTSVLPGVSLR
jgi:hypothetical protein